MMILGRSTTGRAGGSEPQGCWFDPSRPNRWGVVQLDERDALNVEDAGSSPVSPAPRRP